MTTVDFPFVFQWWLTFFFLGISCIPLLFLLFPHFFDRGYIFGKVIGIILLSYVTFILGELRLVPFSTINVIFLLIIIAIGNLVLLLRNVHIVQSIKSVWKFFLLE